MTESPAIVAQRILDTRKQMVADYETLKRVRQARQLKDLERMGIELVDIATGALPLAGLRDVAYRVNRLCSDLDDDYAILSPDLKEFLEP